MSSPAYWGQDMPRDTHGVVRYLVVDQPTAPIFSGFLARF
jgi:hypothetical protein